jgi:hypothetical protein
VLCRPQAAIAPRCRRTLQDCSPAVHPRQNNVYQRRRPQRSRLTAVLSSASVALEL